MNIIYIRPYDLPEGIKKSTYEHMLGRRLLRYGLFDCFGFDTTREWLEDHIVCEDGGKPVIPCCPGVHFNISHCDGVVVCALSREPIGVDIEGSRHISRSLIRRLMTEKEQLFFRETAVDAAAEEEWLLRFWTLKESYLKYTGEGLRGGMKDFSFVFEKVPESVSEDNVHEERLWQQDWSVACSDPSVRMYQWQMPGHPKKILSACTQTEEHFELRYVDVPWQCL